jgi:hypothetical protein
MKIILKKPYITSIMIVIYIMIFHVSCKKDEVASPDFQNTKITFNKPVINAILKHDDLIAIDAIITSDVSMHGYEILLHDNTNNTSISILNKHTHGKKIIVEHVHKILCAKPTAYTLEIIAIINHDSLKLSEKIKFTCT